MRKLGKLVTFGVFGMLGASIGLVALPNHATGQGGQGGCQWESFCAWPEGQDGCYYHPYMGCQTEDVIDVCETLLCGCDGTSNPTGPGCS
jgi:hypothetical protein